MVGLKVRKTAFIGLLSLALTIGFYSRSFGQAQSVSITQGQSATLNAASVNGVAFQWLKNGSFITGATQSKYVVNAAGMYQVLSTNALNCTSDLSDPVTVNVLPALNNADMAIGITSVMTTGNVSDPFNYTIIIKNNGPVTASDVDVQNRVPDEVQFKSMTSPVKGTASYSDFNKNITWKLGQLNNGESASLVYTVVPLKTGKIVNTATVSASTTDPNMGNNIATTAETVLGLTIPNVFTPNGDGVNDSFEIPGLESYPANELVIMNRWGNTVYQKKNYKNEWNGQGLNEGTYFYLLKVQTSNGKWDVYKGYVTLLRAKLN